MNWVDIGFLILVGGGGLFGYVSGFLNQIGRLLGVFSAVYGAVHFHLPVTHWLKSSVDQPFAGLLSYVLLFIVIYLICLGVVKLLDHLLKKVDMKEEDRQLGAVLGVVKGILISAMLLLGFAVYPGNTVARDIQVSYTGEPLLLLSRTLVVQIPDEVRERIDRTMDRVDALPAGPSEPSRSSSSPSRETKKKPTSSGAKNKKSKTDSASSPEDEQNGGTNEDRKASRRTSTSVHPEK